MAALLTILLMFGRTAGDPQGQRHPRDMRPGCLMTAGCYTIDIQIEDWDAFIENAESEEYEACTVEIDGEEFIISACGPRETIPCG